MGNAASKNARQFGRKLPEVYSTVAKKQEEGILLKKRVSSDYLSIHNDGRRRIFEETGELEGKGAGNKEAIGTNPAVANPEPPKIYTERPQEDLGDDEDATKSDFLRKAVDMGIVKVKGVEDKNAQGQFDTNHVSLRILKNREKVEKEYEDLEGDSPEKVHYDIPKRFLTEDQLSKMNKPRRRGVNTFGLLDARDLSKMIKAYRISGEEELGLIARRKESKAENVKILQRLIDSGIINLPTNKVTMAKKYDAEGQVTKERFVVVEDDWVNEERGKIKKDEVKNKGKGREEEEEDPNEILNQFKRLEDLIKEDEKPKEGDIRKHKASGGEVKRFL
ncbi:DEKNAAC103383 [Brettanomyces naardenensis]|uniref:DEKNAAC103383 n=1 Tax=Brettanomyces naardenensis TaxID=13370 RepID=A0A448YNE9_BRENA|nr:DEKNAAC103383 [Brettanomyces naardenensis]